MQEFINLQVGNSELKHKDNKEDEQAFKSTKKMTMDKINTKILNIDYHDVLLTLDLMRK
jgi:hypothetical protein